MKLFGVASLLALQGLAVEAITTANNILVIARDAYAASTATSGLQGYGIPFTVQLVPSGGATLPALNSSATAGNFGGIVIVSEVAYSYPTGFLSALTAAQFTTLYNYQTAFGVRMVRLDVYPGPDFGMNARLRAVNPQRSCLAILTTPHRHYYCHCWRGLLRCRRGTAGQLHQHHCFPHGQPQDVSWRTPCRRETRPTPPRHGLIVCL